MSSMLKVVATGAALLTGTAQAVQDLITADSMITCGYYSSIPVSVDIDPPMILPQDVAVDGGGDVFVVDSGRRELVRIDSVEDQYVLLSPEYLQVPVGVAVSPTHGDVYVGDENSSTVWVLSCQTRNSSVCNEYHPTPFNLSLASAVHPQGLLIDSDDHLFIADTNGQRVWRRDALSEKMTPVLYVDMLESVTTFQPHDLAIDLTTLALYVTDVANDEVWTIPCQTPSASGFACDVYSNSPSSTYLTGTDILQPSGIDVDYLGTKYITGMANGVVAEISGNVSVDLLNSNDDNEPIKLGEPVALALDRRASTKTIYISDDPELGADATDVATQGLYALNCQQLVCVPLEEKYVTNVVPQSCANTAINSECDVQCKPGFSTPNSVIECTPNGWLYENIACLPIESGSGSGSGGAVPPAASNDAVVTTAAPGDAGVAVGVTIVVLVVIGVGVFLFVRYKQGKLVIKRSTDYTTTFGKPENV